jgi:hypothetical protein
MLLLNTVERVLKPLKRLPNGFEVMKLHSLKTIIAPRKSWFSESFRKNNFIKEAHLKER